MDRWGIAAVTLLLLPAGCGDRLSQGDRVVLVDEAADKVRVHAPGTVPDQPVATGTRASVTLDDPKEIGEDRPVKVNLLDPPYAGMGVTVRRKNLKRE